jgi:uracil phosphoribosyltransferase
MMRAGLPFFQGFLNLFDRAESAFIGAYRGKHADDHTFEIEMEYMASPDLNNKTVVLIDPMLATGKSFLRAYEGLTRYGTPNECHVVAAIASRKGIEFVQENMPEAKIWVGAIDEVLNHKFYIVPGLGDAGDLAFGAKI